MVVKNQCLTKTTRRFFLVRVQDAPSRAMMAAILNFGKVCARNFDSSGSWAHPRTGIGSGGMSTTIRTMHKHIWQWKDKRNSMTHHACLCRQRRRK